MVSPGGKLVVANWILTARHLPFSLICSSALQGALTVQGAGLWTIATQWTVPSRLQELVTARICRLHCPQGVGVRVGVRVRVAGTGVFVRVLVRVGVLVTAGR